MAMYSPGAKRELTKKRALRLERIEIPSGWKIVSAEFVNEQVYRLRRLKTFAVLCAPRTRPD